MDIPGAGSRYVPEDHVWITLLQKYVLQQQLEQHDNILTMKSDGSRLIVPSKPGDCPKKTPSSMPITLSDVDNINTPTLTCVVLLHTAQNLALYETYIYQSWGFSLFLKACSEREYYFSFFCRERNRDHHDRQHTFLSATLQAGSPVPTRQDHVVPAN